MRLVYEGFSLLLTGDTSVETEREMMAVGRSLSAVVYKAGHHGARSSSSKPFLDAVQAQYVVISAGDGNRFGHPHEEVLERIEKMGTAVMRTDQQGTIELITDGQRMWWDSHH
jgi:beta-lactamase superfamily II metal-dependent hydrolase